MKKNIKYFINIGLIGLIFVVFLSPLFSFNVTEPTIRVISYNGYQIMFDGVMDLAPTIFIDVSVILLIGFAIMNIIAIFFKRTIRPFYYAGLIVYTMAFVCFATSGFISQNIAWGFYFSEGIMAIILIFTLSFELIAVKGF